MPPAGQSVRRAGDDEDDGNDGKEDDKGGEAAYRWKARYVTTMREMMTMVRNISIMRSPSRPDERKRCSSAIKSACEREAAGKEACSTPQ